MSLAQCLTRYPTNDHLLSDKDFQTQINQLKDLVEKVNSMHKQMGVSERGGNYFLKKSQLEMLEPAQKRKIWSQGKNSFVEIISGRHSALGDELYQSKQKSRNENKNS